MIPIHIPIENLAKASIKGLVEYICDKQGLENRVLGVRITNCVDDTDVQSAIKHMQDVQEMNQTRGLKCAKGELNYHLLVSFKNPERPTFEQMRIIEDRLCEALGFDEHQRVSAIHGDTDHLHMHIAINKIHPKTHNIQDPKGDYRILAKTCTELEKELGLTFDNHTPKNTVEQGQIKNIEAKTGIKSLLTYAEENCLDNLKKAQSWQDMHKILGKFGLAIKPRGSGLVIAAFDRNGKAIKGAHIKASQLGRQFSKGKLEAKFGAFYASKTAIGVKQYYEFEPVTKLDNPNSQKLWDEYKQNQNLTKNERSQAISSAIAQKKALAAQIYKNKMPQLPITNKWDKVAHDLNQARYAIYRNWELQAQKYYANLAIEQAKREYQRQSWLDYLKNQALSGNAEALETLRCRKSKPVLSANNGIKAAKSTNSDYIAPENKKPNKNNGFPEIIEENQKRKIDKYMFLKPIDGITKNGTIIYTSKSGAIRDDGINIAPCGNSTQNVIEAIKLARQKHGKNLVVNGNQAFKQRTIWATT